MECNQITMREKEVLQLISREMTTEEIARALHISAHTVITHRKNLLGKMGARNTAGLMRRAFEHGMLSIAVCFLLICASMTDLYGQEEPDTLGFHVEEGHNVLLGDRLYGTDARMMWLSSKSALRAGTSKSKHKKSMLNPPYSKNS